MRIIVFDSWNGKFSAAIVEHWRNLGHQVLVNPQWEAMLEAELTFFYQADNTAVEGVVKPHTGRIFVQCVDIEVWAGQADAVDWSHVHGVIFMAQHIKNRVDFKGLDNAIIKPGIDTAKWTMKKDFNAFPKYMVDAKEVRTETLDPHSWVPVEDIGSVNEIPNPVRKIAYVVGNGRIWDVKRLDIAFQLLKDLITSGKYVWQLHIRGTYSSHAQYNAYCQYLEKDLELEGHVFWYQDRIEDMNQWLDDKDYYLNPSTKEAFSYATAEAMSKGIKPILNNWEGSKNTWGKYICNTYGEMLAEFLQGEHNPQEYRDYIVKNYNQDRYLSELDTFMEVGKEVINYAI